MNYRGKEHDEKVFVRIWNSASQFISNSHEMFIKFISNLNWVRDTNAIYLMSNDSLRPFLVFNILLI